MPGEATLLKSDANSSLGESWWKTQTLPADVGAEKLELPVFPASLATSMQVYDLTMTNPTHFPDPAVGISGAEKARFLAGLEAMSTAMSACVAKTVTLKMVLNNIQTILILVPGSLSLENSVTGSMFFSKDISHLASVLAVKGPNQHSVHLHVCVCYIYVQTSFLPSSTRSFS